MKECFVSLIIPVYNMERYLKRCLDSAVHQTLENIQIIIVNDGSIDGSPSIIDAYAEKDGRIRVIHQENRGLSEARNAGIKAADGEYLAFLDSDDWMDLHFLERMYTDARDKNADIVICNHAKVIENLGTFPSFRHCRSDMLTVDDALRKIISDSGIQSFAWNKLYKRSLFASNDVYYPKGLYFEDLATTFKLFYYAERIAVVGEHLYYYLQRKTGISKMHNLKRVYDNINATAIMREFLEAEGVFEKYIHEYQYLCFKILLCTVFNLTVIYVANGEPGLLRSLRHSFTTLRALMTAKQEKKEEQESRAV